MRDGVELDDGPAHFDNILEAGGEGANRWWRVTLKEGRNREVRRIFDAVGVTVSRLIRIRYGIVALPPGLKRGQSADLSAESVTELMASVGLKQRQGGRPGTRSRPGGRAGARTKPESRPQGGNRAPKAFEGPMSSESRLAVDPHDRALDAEDYEREGHDDEWQPSGPDAHLSHLAGKPKKNQGAKKPNPLQTTWGTAKPASGGLSAPAAFGLRAAHWRRSKTERARRRGPPRRWPQEAGRSSLSKFAGPGCVTTDRLIRIVRMAYNADVLQIMEMGSIGPIFFYRRVGEDGVGAGLAGR